MSIAGSLLTGFYIGSDRIVQEIYLNLRKNDLLLQKSEEMTYCEGCSRSVPSHDLWLRRSGL